MPIGIDFENKVFCRFCNEYFEKGTGHLCYCADCDSKGLPCRHPMCESCYQKNKKEGIIKETNYTKLDISDKLKDRLV